jgi:hypothetical protein
VISDAHEGLKAAIAAVFVGSAWQRCRVHYGEPRIMWTRGVEPLLDAGLAFVQAA